MEQKKYLKIFTTSFPKFPKLMLNIRPQIQEAQRKIKQANSQNKQINKQISNHNT